MSNLIIRQYAAETNEWLIFEQVKDHFRYVANPPANARRLHWQCKLECGAWVYFPIRDTLGMIRARTGLSIARSRLAMMILEKHGVSQ